MPSRAQRHGDSALLRHQVPARILADNSTWQVFVLVAICTFQRVSRCWILAEVCTILLERSKSEDKGPGDT